MVFQVSSFQCATVNLGRLQYKVYSVLFDSEINWEHFITAANLGVPMGAKKFIQWLTCLHNLLVTVLTCSS
jgi:hypothetical protein